MHYVNWDLAFSARSACGTCTVAQLGSGRRQTQHWHSATCERTASRLRFYTRAVIWENFTGGCIERFRRQGTRYRVGSQEPGSHQVLYARLARIFQSYCGRVRLRIRLLQNELKHTTAEKLPNERYAIIWGAPRWLLDGTCPRLAWSPRLAGVRIIEWMRTRTSAVFGGVGSFESAKASRKSGLTCCSAGGCYGLRSIFLRQRQAQLRHTAGTFAYEGDIRGVPGPQEVYEAF